MPHIIVEYSANLTERIVVGDLLEVLTEAILAQRDGEGESVYLVGGVRARALRYDEYRIADGYVGYGFVHVTIKIGAGRPDNVERLTASEAFEAMTELLEPLLEGQLVALSLDLERLSEAGGLKRNPIHAHLKAAALSQAES